MLGATITLVLVVALSVVAVEAVHITGFASEESTIIDTRAAGDISLHGLVIAGIVIGTLGVLDDITVSQASTVLALRRADPGMPMRRLFREAMTVGRDHLGATVNTLVLAYAGASLPTMLIFASQATPFADAVGYEAVAEQIFGGIRARRLLLEYDDPRSGSFEPLVRVPGDRWVVLGLVTTKRPRLESVDDLARRIEAASRYVPLERLAVSPQCGFATSVLGNALTTGDERAKLALVAEVARKVWG
jgi:hypothetical protein